MNRRTYSVRQTPTHSKDQKGPTKALKRSLTLKPGMGTSPSKGKEPFKPVGKHSPKSVPPSVTRVLIIGKSGSGKSTIGNILLDKSAFPVQRGMSPKTVETKEASTTRQGEKIMVTDTPDINNVPKHMAAKVKQTLKRHVSDIVLLAIRCDQGYTKEQFEVYKTTVGCLDKNAQRQLVVAFTFGNSLKGDIKAEIAGASSHLRKVLEHAKQRYVVFDEKSCISVKANDLDNQMKFILPDSPMQDSSDDADDFRQHGAAFLEAGATSHRSNAVSSGFSRSETLRLLIIGEMGSGKSTLANMIVGKNTFQTGSGMSAKTETAQKEKVLIDNINVEVVDTPDVTNMDEWEHEERQAEVARWMHLTENTPDAVILTIRSDDKYTPEKKSIYLQTRSLLKRDLSTKLVVAFTFADPRNTRFEQDLPYSGQHLRAVLNEADNRYVIVDAESPPAQKKAQVFNLIQIVRDMARTGCR